MCERELQPIKKKKRIKKKRERAPAKVLLEKKRIKERCSQISRQSAREDRDKGKEWRRKKREKKKRKETCGRQKERMEKLNLERNNRFLLVNIGVLKNNFSGGFKLELVTTFHIKF